MKWFKVFSVFLVLHAIGWIGAHLYKKDRPEHVLVVADTSFALKPEYPAMQRWIENYASDNRYRNIIVGTDKALIGPLDTIPSVDSLFRVSFGRSNAESLKRYSSEKADARLFLSDGTFEPSGWTLVTFPQ